MQRQEHRNRGSPESRKSGRRDRGRSASPRRRKYHRREEYGSSESGDDRAERHGSRDRGYSRSRDLDKEVEAFIREHDLDTRAKSELRALTRPEKRAILSAGSLEGRNLNAVLMARIKRLPSAESLRKHRYISTESSPERKRRSRGRKRQEHRREKRSISRSRSVSNSSAHSRDYSSSLPRQGRRDASLHEELSMASGSQQEDSRWDSLPTQNEIAHAVAQPLSSAPVRFLPQSTDQRPVLLVRGFLKPENVIPCLEDVLAQLNLPELDSPMLRSIQDEDNTELLQIECRDTIIASALCLFDGVLLPTCAPNGLSLKKPIGIYLTINIDPATLARIADAARRILAKPRAMPPPTGYTCHRCGLSSHYLADCPVLQIDGSDISSNARRKQQANEMHTTTSANGPLVSPHFLDAQSALNPSSVIVAQDIIDSLNQRKSSTVEKAPPTQTTTKRILNTSNHTKTSLKEARYRAALANGDITQAEYEEAIKQPQDEILKSSPHQSAVPPGALVGRAVRITELNATNSGLCGIALTWDAKAACYEVHAQDGVRHQKVPAAHLEAIEKPELAAAVMASIQEVRPKETSKEDTPDESHTQKTGAAIAQDDSSPVVMTRKKEDSDHSQIAVSIEAATPKLQSQQKQQQDALPQQQEVQRPHLLQQQEFSQQQLPYANPYYQQQTPALSSSRSRGTCKWFDESRKFGFILPADPALMEAFVHKSELLVPSIAKGDLVEYTAVFEDNKPKAKQVTLLSASPMVPNASSAPYQQSVPQSYSQQYAAHGPLQHMQGYTQTPGRLLASVRRFDSGTSFGFLNLDSLPGTDVFCHKKDIVGHTQLFPGDRVELTYGTNPVSGQPKAFNVVKIAGKSHNEQEDIAVPLYNGMRLTGKVTSFDTSKNYGFIVSDNTQKVFLHATEMMSIGSVAVGDRVTFSLVSNRGNPRAVRVNKLADGDMTVLLPSTHAQQTTYAIPEPPAFTQENSMAPYYSHPGFYPGAVQQPPQETFLQQQQYYWHQQQAAYYGGGLAS